MIGQVSNHRTLYMHETIGEAKMGKNRYKVATVFGKREPLVYSHQSKRYFVITWEEIMELAIKAGIDKKIHEKNPIMVERQCAERTCQKSFMARKADVKRGWAKFCSKSCKAKDQTRRTGRGKR